MAKTKGPLMSLTAVGNWGKGALQFRQGKRGTHAYRPPNPDQVNQQPPSATQATNRAAYAAIMSAWRQLTPAERIAHNQAAAATGEPLSGWNGYFRAIRSKRPIATAALMTDAGELITTDDGEAIIEG
ncbi:MAG: hypothetical protein RKO66_05450 [Candidatus Contendobacter sp.]|nr:hypothetical protein [Candidatus Contendobacter sp.]MDS4058219.1 hypothetical protein [Candidatus Contendobacter sp.]